MASGSIDDGSLHDRTKSHDYVAHVTLTECGDLKLPIITFRPDAVLVKPLTSMRHLGEKFHLTYKLVQTDCKLVRSLMTAYGFHEVHPSSPDFNLMWSSTHLGPSVLCSLTEHQKVNHFPRSFELTRKDRLYKNIQRMQEVQGTRHFDFIPQSFVVPVEYNEFCSEFKKWRGLWIVKPLALSRGRGIFIVSKPDELPLDDPLLVSKYIDNPLLINGYKFDLRLYAAVTSFHPLVIYLYREGIVRFATEKYRRGIRHLHNQCMHLTNYSVNRHSAKYVRCYDPNVENYGNKWSLSALLGHLQRLGYATGGLLTQIKDIVVKAIISAELPIGTACRTYVPHFGNCFELYGFDIILDDTLRPWLLEINFSPSLSCDMPLDLKIKARLVSDILNLAGLVAHDPLLKRFQQKKASCSSPVNRSHSVWQHRRAFSAGASRIQHKDSLPCKDTNASGYLEELLHAFEEGRVLQRFHSEYERRGHFARIFPSQSSWELYGSFMSHHGTRDYNLMLHRCLFPSSYPSSLSLSRCIGYQSLQIGLCGMICVLCGRADLTRCGYLIYSPGRIQAFQCGKQSNSITWEGTDGESDEDGTRHGPSSHSSPSLSRDLGGHQIKKSPKDIILESMNSGQTLSKVQARQAFALYLKKVREYLKVSATSCRNRSPCIESFQDQLDLVSHFLKYASKNLPIVTDIALFCGTTTDDPWTRLERVDACIETFLIEYNKETLLLSKTGCSRCVDSFVSQEHFKTFLDMARAEDLEEVLIQLAQRDSTNWFLDSRKGRELTKSSKQMRPAHL